jgi:hypothetical protein
LSKELLVEGGEDLHFVIMGTKLRSVDLEDGNFVFMYLEVAKASKYFVFSSLSMVNFILLCCLQKATFSRIVRWREEIMILLKVNSWKERLWLSSM